MGSEQPVANEQAGSDEEEVKYSSLYFGYSSNLSPVTFKQRCPGSLYVGLARLDDWKWIINSTGYATIIPSPGDHVFGALFFLPKRDEVALDISEGVPWLNQKHKLEVIRYGESLGDAAGQKVPAMAYVDVERREVGVIEEDYVIWVNRSIRDGLLSGVPEEYMDKYIRPFTPADMKEITDIQMVRTLTREPLPVNFQRPMPVNVDVASTKK